MRILTVRDYLEHVQGVRTSARASTDPSTLGTTAARVAPQDPRRIALDIVNLSLNRIYVTPLGVPSATNGVRLEPNGGSLALLAAEDGEVVAWEWLGVADAAGSNYFVLQNLLEAGP